MLNKLLTGVTIRLLFEFAQLLAPKMSEVF